MAAVLRASALLRAAPSTVAKRAQVGERVLRFRHRQLDESIRRPHCPDSRSARRLPSPLAPPGAPRCTPPSCAPPTRWRRRCDARCIDRGAPGCNSVLLAPTPAGDRRPRARPVCLAACTCPGKMHLVTGFGGCCRARPTASSSASSSSSRRTAPSCRRGTTSLCTLVRRLALDATAATIARRAIQLSNELSAARCTAEPQRSDAPALDSPEHAPMPLCLLQATACSTLCARSPRSRPPRWRSPP